MAEVAAGHAHEATQRPPSIPSHQRPASVSQANAPAADSEATASARTSPSPGSHAAGRPPTATAAAAAERWRRRQRAVRPAPAAHAEPAGHADEPAASAADSRRWYGHAHGYEQHAAVRRTAAATAGPGPERPTECSLCRHGQYSTAWRARYAVGRQLGSANTGPFWRTGGSFCRTGKSANRSCVGICAPAPKNVECVFLGPSCLPGCFNCPRRRRGQWRAVAR